MQKRIILLAFITVLSFAFWFDAKLWLQEPTFGLAKWHLWAGPLVLLLVLASTNVLALMLFEKLYFRLAVGVIIGLSFLAVFGFNVLYLWAPTLIVLSQWYATRGITEELASRVRVNPTAVARRAMSYVILPLFVAISIVFSQNQAIQTSADRKQLPSVVFKSIEEISHQVIDYQTRQADLSPAQEEQVKRAFASELRRQVNDFVRPYLHLFEYLPFLVGVGMFLVLWGFGFIFFPLSRYLTKSLFMGLKYMGWVQVQETHSMAQSIVHF